MYRNSEKALKGVTGELTLRAILRKGILLYVQYFVGP